MGVWGLGFGAWGLRLRAWGFGLRVSRVLGLGFLGLGFWGFLGVRGLGLWGHKALLQPDGFTGARTTGDFELRRNKWAEENNGLLPAKQPVGWSAKGQACDRLFGVYKVRVAMDVSLPLRQA